MPKKLKQLLIDRVDLVGKGDNPEAHVVLFKGEESPDGGDVTEIIKRFEERLTNALSKMKGVGTMFDFKKFMEELPEDQRKGLEKHLETLESAKIKTLTKQLEDKEGNITELTGKVADLQKAAEAGAPKDDPDAVIKELPEDVRKMVEDAMAKADASEALAKQLQEDALNKEYAEKASVFSALPIKADEIGPVFKRIADASKEDYEKVEALLKAADEQLVQNNLLLKELGSGGENSDSRPAWQKIEADSKQLMEADPELTKERAIAKALRANPELYAAYEKESLEVQ